MNRLTQLEAALAYAARGWPIFPCRGRIPAIAGGRGLHDATTDAEQIRAWWTEMPDATIGLNCGAAGILVIDLDRKSGRDGLSAFHALAGLEPLGCELIAQTPSGNGQHLFYRADPARPVASTISKIAPGIDTRAMGGYVILPSPAEPLRTWVVGDPLEGDTVAIDKPPPWLDALLPRLHAERPAQVTTAAAKSDSGVALPLLPETVASIRSALVFVCNDEREDWLKVGMALKSTGAQQQAYDLWVEWSRSTANSALYQGAPGDHPKFDAADQLRVWRSLSKFFADGTEITIATLFWLAQEHGWQGDILDIEAALEPLPAAPVACEPIVRVNLAPPAGEFPIELIDVPGIIGPMVQWMLATSSQRQPALCLASAITSIGALLGRRVRTPTNLRTNIYALGIGRTGCGKDASISRPVTLFAHSQLERLIGPGEWKSDSGLRAALIDHPSHVCFIDEFTKVLKVLSGDRIPPHLAGIKRYLLELFSRAGSVHMAPGYADRKLNAPIHLNEPNLCLYGTGTPDDLFAALDRGAVADGFLGRFLCFMVDDDVPPRMPRLPSDVPPPELVAQLQALERRTAPTGNLAGSSSGLGTATGARLVPLAGEAEAMIATIQAAADDAMRRMHAVGDPMADVANRRVEHTLKLALTRAASDDAEREITLTDVEWADRIVRWCTERLRLVATERIASTPYEAELQRILREIRSAGPQGCTSNQLARAARTVSSRSRKEILAHLLEAGMVSQEVTMTAGRPFTTYRATEVALGHS